MPIFTADKNTKKVLRDDIAFINRVIADATHMKSYPLTKRGQKIFKMLWEEEKSFSQVAQKLSLTKGRVMQIYHIELRRLTYFINTTFKEHTNLIKENESLQKENEELKRNTVALQIV